MDVELISKEEYQKVFEENKGFSYHASLNFKPQHYVKGDIIHTIAYHYIEDEEGNDINQNMIFVNPDVVNGEYEVVGDDFGGAYSCITIKSVFGDSGVTAHISPEVILENYKQN